MIGFLWECAKEGRGNVDSVGKLPPCSRTSGWGTRPADQRSVEFPGRPGRPSTHKERGTFSWAAVVKVDEVGVLSPFTTRSGGDWPSGDVAAEGFKALTTSLMAFALLVCLTRALIGEAHRGSGTGR